MTKDNVIDFNSEFNYIDSCIKAKKYRYAGYICGYMLEYMLLKIIKKLKAEADHELSVKLNQLIQKVGEGIELDKFGLGELIGLINKETPLKNNSSTKQKAKLLSLACHRLTDCKLETTINFSHLSKIRNHCAHPFKEDPTLKDIEKFKYVLKTLSVDFNAVFDREMLIKKDKTKYHSYLLLTLTALLVVSALLVIFYMTGMLQ